jgi:hypothetical protein
MKFCEIYWFAKHAKFRETDDEFRLVSCFAKLKKTCETEPYVGATLLMQLWLHKNDVAPYSSDFGTATMLWNPYLIYWNIW